MSISGLPPHPPKVRGDDRIPHFNQFGRPTIFGDPTPTVLQKMSLSGPEGELPNSLCEFRTSFKPGTYADNN
jgi:hypothetical protein